MFRSGLIPTDMSEYSLSLGNCVDLYRRLGMSTVQLLHVSEKAETEFIGPISEQLDAFARTLREAGMSVQTVIEEGEDPSALILKRAEEIQPDVLIMGSHGKGVLKRFLLGSVSQRVLAHWSRPTLIERLPFEGLESGELRRICQERLSSIILVTRPQQRRGSGFDIVLKLAHEGLPRVLLFTALELSDLVKIYLLDRISHMEAQVVKGLEEAASPLMEAGLPVEMEVASGPLVSSLLEKAEEVKAGLVILDLQGPDDPWQELVERVVARLPCSTLVTGRS